ncbi:aminoacetone oxidase family FAD-binding enzyme [Candidatus Campbellbacteria bacterium CG22_combo_CG10-13_8_21_14_all_36_13]|uniref:Aminoacetone oxidase family FAD-binding enzyme n=1 Tax=Candidatus Campbellbacteria bacterium CG22_combo_CG10-13_8_21_14_all_36_13 TaxID=1974529 RepID=A0A2H0DY43_9BACT|nr:MAG: aminoacetone oxidase family FAD-binding enzyme [Candidatus Campbellbacteria bacterium CG22_combo_CG10-13_8_21_14_all_36_13]
MPRNQSREEYDLIVIGGGASGMMAAGVAGENGKKVLLIEKNRKLGEKLKITGGGRCNITNATFDQRKLLSKFGDADKFLYSAFSQFGVEDTFKFFESRGLPLVVEARDRVFPKSQKALDVFKVMEKYISNKNIEILRNSPVKRININKKEKKIISVETKDSIHKAKNYILATGGSSHPETGSTGDGFQWLQDIGHSVEKPSPNIVPIKISEKWVKELAGTSLSFMKIIFYVNDKKAFSATGKILFTHFGLSGPLILNSAHKIADLLHEGQVTAKIDCYPDTDMGALEKRILKVFDNNKNKSFKNIVKEIVPQGLSKTFLDFKIIADENTKVHSISKEERKKIVSILKALPLTVEELMGMDRAVISDGGVSLKEVDTKTMKSKLFNNLYLTGDILHVNRPSGGYSLQLCWTTGYVAGLLK